MNRLLLLVVLLCSACSADPHVGSPIVPAEPSFTGKGELVSIRERIALGDRIASDWWMLFASKPLDNLIHTAISGNYALSAARETLAEANEAVKASEGHLLPQASIGAAAGRQKYGAALFGPANFTIPPFNYYEAGPMLSWTPDLFGGQHHAVELQKALAQRKAHLLDATYLALTGSVVETSLEIASSNAEISAIQAILKTDRKTLELVQDAYEIGSVSRSDLLSARARLLSDQSLLPSVQQRLASARHRLAILEGKTPAGWVPPSISLEDFRLPGKLPVALPSELARRRPDILAAEDNLQAASAVLGIATANLYPGITLTANMLQEALTPAGIFRGTATAWSMAAGISTNLFDGGALSAEKREARDAYNAALASYRQTILDAFGNVADALTALEADDNSVSTLQSEAATAKSSADLDLASYEEGAIGLLQVQERQHEFLNAKLALVRSEHRRFVDCARLFLALGGSPLRR